MSNPDLSQGDAGLAPSSYIDPAIMNELNELRAYRDESQQVFDQLKPHGSRIKRMLEDENAARIFDDSLSAYEQIQQRNKPKLSQEWDPEINPYLKKLEKVYDTVTNFEQRTQQYEKQQQESVNQRLLAENTKLAEQLVEKYPNLKEKNYAGIAAITAFATQNNIPFSDAATALEPVYARSSVEPTLRPELGAPGVPGPSEKGEVDMVQRAAELIRNQQRKAGMNK